MYTTIFFFSILPRLRAVVVKFIRLKIYKTKKKQKKEKRIEKNKNKHRRETECNFFLASLTFDSGDRHYSRPVRMWACLCAPIAWPHWRNAVDCGTHRA